MWKPFAAARLECRRRSAAQRGARSRPYRIWRRIEAASQPAAEHLSLRCRNEGDAAGCGAYAWRPFDGKGDPMTQGFILYGMPASLYTAKPRAYLRKQGIAFEERPVGDPGFARCVAAAGRFIMPILEAPDGNVIQDGAAILDWIEAQGLAVQSAYPATPRHRIAARVFELFGGEGLLRPAMHYRWNFDAENRAFLRHDFVAALAPQADQATGDAMFDRASTRMRAAADGFGVSAETAPTIEARYRTFLALFDAHLAQSPYLLGARPTLGDYALLGPLYAHLGRDPAPARLMQQIAPRVWRWTERMNAPEPMQDGLAASAEAQFADDAAPPTLAALLGFVAEDYLPEIAAHIGFANDWLAARPDLAEGSNGMDDPAARAIGKARFDWHGHSIATLVMPYRFWLLQRLQADFVALDPTGQAAAGAMLDAAGLSSLLTLRTLRPVQRRDHLEVWGAPQTAPA